MLIISLFLFTINGDMYDELVRMWKHLKSCVIKNHMCVMVHVQVDYTSHHVQIIIQMILCNQVGDIETKFCYVKGRIDLICV
jgi:hypothetical protein